jgi:molybdenum cofactor guanylyltransferase
MFVKFSGAVLAGGKSRRFGENKALYLYQNKALIQWVLDSLDEASERFVIANRPLELNFPVYPDLRPGFDSLSGVHAALSYATHDWVAVAGCDLPFLTSAYWKCLLAQSERTQLVIARSSAGHLEPLAALYHRSLLPVVEAQLERGDLALKHLVDHDYTKVMPWSDLELHFDAHLFLNANTKVELTQ